MISAPPRLFNPVRVRMNRLRAEKQKSGAHPLFQDSERQLLERLSEIRKDFSDILVLGTFSQDFLHALLGQNPSRRITVECLSPLLGFSAPFQSVVLEGETLPFAPASFDLILSLSSLHFINDVPGYLVQCRRLLRPDGLFLASFFGSPTLNELRTAMTEAELSRNSGAGQHIAPFMDIRDAGMLLMRAGFALPAADRDTFTLLYSHIQNLVRDLRQMGQNQPLYGFHKKYPGRTFLHDLTSIYKKRFGNETGDMPATFTIYYLTGWAPSPNQQQPLKPGQAQTSLIDALESKKSPPQ